MMIVLLDIANLNVLPYSAAIQTLLQTYPYSDPNQIYVPDNSYQLLNYNDCFFTTVFSNLYSQIATILAFLLLWWAIRVKPEEKEEIKKEGSKASVSFTRRMRIKADSALRESLFYSSFIRMVIQNFFILALMTTLIIA